MRPGDSLHWRSMASMRASTRLTWHEPVAQRVRDAVAAAALGAASAIAAASRQALDTPGPPYSRPGEPPRRFRGTLQRSQTSWAGAPGRARAGTRSAPSWAAEANRNRPWLRDTARARAPVALAAGAALAKARMPK